MLAAGGSLRLVPQPLAPPSRPLRRTMAAAAPPPPSSPWAAAPPRRPSAAGYPPPPWVCRARRRVRYGGGEEEEEKEQGTTGSSPWWSPSAPPPGTRPFWSTLSSTEKKRRFYFKEISKKDMNFVCGLVQGFSSLLSSGTSPDPARSVLPARAVVQSVDVVRGPFDPSNIEYLERGLSWGLFKARLTPGRPF
ncbi:unnamed protein product [Spirodela intermedia]|uniref:DUF7734 domain-containing protein n=1 Tax=Spirodela intermedia TaxID=51605 RepID=A0A7I8J4I4_SPIIN|nr:unnamed protein product [Spirodela intermedia]CAA6664281.1 unnamed protein product [Spirodela intermedia]